ncbi:YolD-like family protein [Sporosarcina sp. BI001-red]|uniref:YolD-like family protein n=1 Tax=Sporosarcina sp. BI001-red TaxID=2282866 RepID=UPI000E2408BC|nr:YolD-like family protein [Sporosarcina sp. BI001-red]REB07374.1 YolD-like family protein [Sporosarcina sp. BI001-red]
MLRDRGKIKWTALMLPEHVERLRAWQAEDAVLTRSEPDEQQLEEWNYIIATAMETHQAITITHWQTGKRVTDDFYIHCLEPEKRQLRIVTIDGGARILSLLDIETISKIG